MTSKAVDEEEPKKKLTLEQYRILRQKGTEAPGSGQYLHHDKAGVYRCAVCEQPLFSSDSKYDSTTPGLIGWPSFSEATGNDAVELKPDDSHGMQRLEVVCKNCGSHLGHLFEDDSSPNGKHYCINSACLAFQPTAKK